MPKKGQKDPIEVFPHFARRPKPETEVKKVGLEVGEIAVEVELSLG